MARSIIPGDDPERCFICRMYRPEHVHHVLHGSYRALADRYGLTVHLCIRCHSDLHDKGLYDKELEEIGQEAFEAEYGHDEFMRIFGKNFKR